MGDRNCWTCKHAVGSLCHSHDDRVDDWADLGRVIGGAKDTTPCPGHEYKRRADLRAAFETLGVKFDGSGRALLPDGWRWGRGRGVASVYQPDHCVRQTVICRSGVTRSYRSEHRDGESGWQMPAQPPTSIVLACIADAMLGEVSDA